MGDHSKLIQSLIVLVPSKLCDPKCPYKITSVLFLLNSLSQLSTGTYFLSTGTYFFYRKALAQRNMT